MKTIRGEYLILIGFGLVLLGAILPFLMVMHILTSTIFLNFFSYTVSVGGLFMGLVGCAFYVRHHRRKNNEIPPPMETPPDQHQDW